jgi:hypothetical protein
MTIEATIGGEDMAAALSHSRFRRGINIGAFFVHLRIEMSDLQIRDDSQSHPGKGERPENPKKKRN